MEVEPATIEQVKKSKDGRMVIVEDDVGSVVKQIKEVHESLCVRYSEAGEYWVVFHRDPNTEKETLVTTAQELDHRLLKRVQKLNSGSYDYIKELERLEEAREKATDKKFEEQVGEIGERLAHAIRQDLGVRSDASRSRKTWGKGLVGH